MFEDLISEIGNINSCIAFTSHIKIVFLQIGEFDEELEECSEIVCGNCSII